MEDLNTDVNIWWLAIDTHYSSYIELKQRKVIAQGWPELGNLLTLLPLAKHGYEETFKCTIKALEEVEYKKCSSASKVMWKLLAIKYGDLIVGIEGTKVCGMCKIYSNGFESYRYLFPEAYNYAQTIGFQVSWLDWNESLCGKPPQTPSKSVQGLAHVRKEYNTFLTAWEKLNGISNK